MKPQAVEESLHVTATSAQARSTMFSFPGIGEFDPIETMVALSTYRLLKANGEKDSQVIFGIRFALGNCRGRRKPSPDLIHDLVKAIGEYYRRCLGTKTTPLEFTFAAEALHSNKVNMNISQAIESTWKRFEQHDAALLKRTGLNVANAIYMTKELMNAIDAKMANVKEPRPVKLKKSQFYDFTYLVRPEDRLVKSWRNAMTFSRQQIDSLFPSISEKVEKYLKLTSISLDKIPPTLDPLDPDALYEFPIVVSHEMYYVPVPHYLLYGLTLRLHRELRTDVGYRGQYLGKKGGILEEWAAEELRLLLRSEDIFRNRKYRDGEGKAEADIILNYGDYLIFVECTTKWIDVDAWRGQTVAVQEVLAESIRKCYKQALRAKKAYLDGRLDLGLPKRPMKMLTMVVTDSFYPNLMYEHALASQWHLESYISMMVKDNDYPYIISVNDLETLRRLSDAPLFMQFVLERLEMYNHPTFLAHDEFDYFILFTKGEYPRIKDIFTKSGKVLNYVAHVVPPPVLSNLFMECLDVLGTDSSAVIKPRADYSPEVAANAFGLIYQLYNTWRGGMHLVFNLEEYEALISGYKSRGERCRALVWEGLEEYIDHLRILGESQKADLLRKKLDEGGFGEDTGILIVNPTDIYRNIYREIADRLNKS